MNNKLLVMGVSGCGKSLIGELIAKQYGFKFFDGDDFHPKENVRKMAEGIPLTDEDRKVWLHTLNNLIKEHPQLVIACSALTPAYRDQLRAGNPELRFIYLKGSYDLIWSRLELRRNHYFSGEDMLKSQFRTLQEPTESEAVIVDINQPIDSVVDSAITQLTEAATPTS